MRGRVLVFFVLSCTFGCQHATDEAPIEGEARPRDLVRTVELSLSVDDVSAAASSVRAGLASSDAYVESSTLRGSTAFLVLRVPTNELAEARRLLHALGEVEHEEERSEDVTARRTDVGARLRAARAEEERLLELLRDRTATLADVLAVEARLATVRERIEQLDAHARTIASQVEYASMHVRLAERSTPLWRDPIATWSDAATFGVEAAATVAISLGAFLVASAPVVALLLVALALVLLPLRAIGRRRARA